VFQVLDLMETGAVWSLDVCRFFNLRKFSSLQGYAQNVVVFFRRGFFVLGATLADSGFLGVPCWIRWKLISSVTRMFDAASVLLNFLAALRVGAQYRCPFFGRRFSAFDTTSESSLILALVCS
jgi:hypothetical protein